MGLDSKKDVHLDGSTTGSVSRLELVIGDLEKAGTEHRRRQDRYAES